MQNQKNAIHSQEKTKNQYDFSSLSIPLNQEEWTKYMQNFWSENRNYFSHKEEVNGLISKTQNLSPNNFLLFNTPLESLFFIHQILKPTKIKMTTPYPSYFEQLSNQLKIKPIYSGFFSFQHSEDWVLLSNPNSFTGGIIYLDELEEILEKNHRTYFIIDETWMDFTQQTSSAANLVKHFSNLIIIKSFTETWQKLGVHASVLFSATQNIRVFQRHYDEQAFQPLLWYALFFLLQKVQVPKEDLLRTKAELLKDIAQNSTIEVQNSFTHFFNLKKKGWTGQELQKQLLEKEIKVYYQENQKGILPDFVRITSRSDKENKSLLEALKTL